MLAGDDMYMYAFHAAVENGSVQAFAHPLWDVFWNHFKSFLPPGRASATTLNLLAFVVMALKQSLTFTADADNVLQYGARASLVCVPTPCPPHTDMQDPDVRRQV